MNAQRVAISGASGFVGSALRAALRGREVVAITRSPRGPTDIRWDPARGELDAARLEGVAAVVHLAGESIAGGRWTARKKRAIEQSRVAGTSLLAGAIARCARPPRVLVSASAIGWYGDRGDEILDESSARGTGFLADLCEKWEAATLAARSARTRVCLLRFGLVLDASGGALRRMLLPFRLGLGGRLGSGRQWLSWIALDDLVALLVLALEDERLDGACNATAPQPVTNRVFTEALARALHRPAFLPVPAFALRAVFGELADALLLSSARVLPRRLESIGHRFEFDSIDAALAAMIRARR